MTIELVLNFFDYEQPKFHTLVAEFRKRIFEEVAASDSTGLIFTFVWALELESEKIYICAFLSKDATNALDICFFRFEFERPDKSKNQSR